MKKFIRKLIAYSEIGIGITAIMVLAQDILAGIVYNGISGFSAENFILYAVLYTVVAAWIGGSIKDLVKLEREG